jgi:hypothetical protein
MAPSGNLAKEIGQIVNSSYPVSLGVGVSIAF